MDKELAQLEQWGVDLINNYEESLRKAGVKKGNFHDFRRTAEKYLNNF